MILAQETDILLLDEPTTFLDVKVRVDLITLLRRIAHRDGRTLVVAMHELNVAAVLADRMVLMRDGRIAAERSVQEVFRTDTPHDVFDLEVNALGDPKTGRPVCVSDTLAVATAA